MEEWEIIPPTIANIAAAQLRDRDLKKRINKIIDSDSHDPHLSLQVIDETSVLVRDKKQMVIPNSLQIAKECGKVVSPPPSTSRALFFREYQ